MVGIRHWMLLRPTGQEKEKEKDNDKSRAHLNENSTYAANPGLTPSFRRSLPETGCLSQGLPHGKRHPNQSLTATTSTAKPASMPGSPSNKISDPAEAAKKSVRSLRTWAARRSANG